MNNTDQRTIEIIMQVIILIFLIYAAYTDIRERKVTNKTNLCFLLMRTILILVKPITADNLLGMVLGCIVILIPAMVLNKKAGGDIKLTSVLGYWVGVNNVLKILIIAVITALPVGLIMKRKKGKESIPFASNILIGYIFLTLNFI